MKLTKKLFITIMTMALLVVTFSASTFAWFTLGTESKIENIQVGVTAVKGMEISVDGVEWRNNIYLKDETSEDIEFTAVTTYNEDKPGIKFYDENGVLIENQANAKYFEQTFYVRVSKDDADGTLGNFSVYLSQVKGNDATFANDDDKWLADVSFGNGVGVPSTSEQGPNSDLLPTAADKYAQFGEENTPAKYDAQTLYGFDPLNAVKISFTANETDATTAATVLFGYENTNSNGGVDPNGVAKAYADAKGYPLTLPQGYTLPDYQEFDDNTAEGDDKYAIAETAETMILDKDDFNEASEIVFPLYEGEQPKEDDNFLYATITIRVWLDGWDADCINAILEKGTYLSFKLTAK